MFYPSIVYFEVDKNQDVWLRLSTNKSLQNKLVCTPRSQISRISTWSDVLKHESVSRPSSDKRFCTELYHETISKNLEENFEVVKLLKVEAEERNLTGFHLWDWNPWKI